MRSFKAAHLHLCVGTGNALCKNHAS